MRAVSILACVALAAVPLSLALAPGEARAQAEPPPPVEVQIAGVFGNEALIGDGYTTVSVTLRNRTRETFRGRVRVQAAQWGEPPARHDVPLDLPPGEQRRVRVTLFVVGSATSLEARYEAEGRTLGLASQGASYSPAGRSLVILAEPPRLRATLLDLQASIREESPSYYGASTGSERAVQVPIGVVSLDPATGDPIVPEDALGWSTVAVLAAQASMLARLSDSELDGIRRWVHAGGHLVVFPRSESDLALPLVRETFGEVRRAETRLLAPGSFVPATVSALECARGSAESFGCADRVGAGAIHLTAYDGSAPPHVDDAAVRELLRSITQRALRDPGSHLPFGRRTDTLEQAWWDGRPSFSRLRAALDPNEGYRPALGLVGIVLLFYVIVVGPLNFRFVLKRNRPTLALVSTPLLALGCAAVMLIVGYVGKGVITRYRRIEIIEAVEGASLAPARAYAGYFLTTPSMVELEGRPGGRTLRLATGSSDDGLVYDHGGERPRLVSMRGGLWETIFLRDDRVVDLGPPLRFGYEGETIVSVTNPSSVTLRGAVVIDEWRVYPVGDVEPGATRPVPRGHTRVLTGGWGADDEQNPTGAELADLLGLDADDAGYVRGVLRLVESATSSEPLLWARLDPEPAPESSPSFREDRDLRFLLLRPRPRYDPLGVAALPPPAEGVWAPAQEGAPAELPPVNDPPADSAPEAGGAP